LLINKDEEFPADIIILSSSNSDNSVFINTSSLDGEKNLKPKVITIFNIQIFIILFISSILIYIYFMIY